MSELLVILVVALLFLGPDKLPDAAKKLSQGIREFRQQGRELQRTIQDDTELGAAVRDLKSAIRGDDFHPVPYRGDREEEEDDEGEDALPPAAPDPYGLAAKADDSTDGVGTDEKDHDPDRAVVNERGADQPETPTTAQAAASPPPAPVPVEVESSRRGVSTDDPDGRARG